MPGRISGLSALWSVLLLCGLTSGVRAQAPQPHLYPPIEVWGVTGKSFGTISIAQPLLNNILSHGLIADFVAADGKSLAALAAELWPGANPKCLHFTWLQITIDPGNPPTPLAADGQPQIMPFLDPPVGGYQMIGEDQKDQKPSDALPWLLDETLYIPKKSADMNINNPDILQEKRLRWHTNKYSASPPDAMRYDTVLVLVNDCTSQYEPLGGFHWQANFLVNGDLKYEVKPFGPEERFTFEALVTAFAKTTRLKQKLRPWTIRPLDKPSKSMAKPQTTRPAVKP